MLAANKVKMSGSEKKKKLARTRNIYDFSSIKRARTLKSCKTMAKKCTEKCAPVHVQSFFSLLNSSNGTMAE